MGARAFQLPSQSRSAPPLRHAAQDQHHFRGPTMGLLKLRPRPRVEHAATTRTAVVQNGLAMTPVDDHCVVLPATRTLEPTGMQEIYQFLIAGLFVHEFRQREVHDCSSMSSPSPPSKRASLAALYSHTRFGP